MKKYFFCLDTSMPIFWQCCSSEISKSNEMALLACHAAAPPYAQSRICISSVASGPDYFGKTNKSRKSFSSCIWTKVSVIFTAVYVPDSVAHVWLVSLVFPALGPSTFTFYLLSVAIYSTVKQQSKCKCATLLWRNLQGSICKRL